MKRFGTILLILSFFALSAHAQSVRTTSLKPVANALTQKARFANWLSKSIPAANPFSYPDQAQTIYKTEGVSYFPDTSNGNWWVYGMILNHETGDSLNFFHPLQFTDGESLYLQNADSIGNQGINLNGSIVDVFDTMYDRAMAIRVTPPTDLGARVYLDSANITFFVEAMDPGDVIRVLAVPVQDQSLSNGGGSYPFPAVFPSNAFATATISGSQVTAGQINSMTVSFANGGKLIPTLEKKQFAIAAYVDGPNFTGDTVGYLLEADPNPVITNQLTLDTDGSLSAVTGLSDMDGNPIPMRTYLVGLDNGNTSYQGTPLGYLSGGRFFLNNVQLDASGNQTGQAYDGNLAIASYFHGTAVAGVSQSALAGYGLGESYPNPVSSGSEINYNIGESGPVTITLYNQIGEPVQTIVKTIQGAGVHTASFTPGTLPNGMYYYKLQSGDFTATRQMVISR